MFIDLKLIAAGTNICKSKKSGPKIRANFDQKIIVFVVFLLVLVLGH